MQWARGEELFPRCMTLPGQPGPERRGLEVNSNAGGASGESLYKKEPKVYPRDVSGRFASLRKLSVFVLLGLYYILPWINIGGQQSVLFDLPARRFYILGLTFFPQDFIYLALLLNLRRSYPVFLHCAGPDASGVVLPVPRQSGPRCSSGWNAGSRAIATSA